MAMVLSIAELALGKEAVADLLDELGLGAYVFEVGPHGEEGLWELRVERAMKDGWQSLSLPVEPSLLLASRTDASARSRLLREWGRQLGAGKRARAAKG
jgi:hypothetical protein